MNIISIRRQNVQALIQRHQLSLRSFADAIERSPAQVSAIAGRNPHKGIGHVLARHIEERFNLPAGALDVPSDAESNAAFLKPVANRLPVLGAASAGRIMENIENTEIEEYVVAPGPTGPDAFALKIEGISMEEKFHEGDKIIIDPDLEWKNGDFVYAIRVDENTGTFKQLRTEGDQYFLCAINPSFEPRYTRMDGEWKIVGKARWRVEDL